MTLLFHVAEISRNIIDEIRSYDKVEDANKAFCARVRVLREDHGYSDEEKYVQKALRAGYWEAGDSILSICGGKVEKAE